MLLYEIKQSTFNILFEDVEDLIQQLRAVSNETQGSSSSDEFNTACQYLAFLIAYRDVDYITKDDNPLPIEHFLQPGVKSATQALQFFARKANKHPSVVKKVNKYTTKFQSPADGKRFFDFQLKEVERYFQKRKHSASNNKVEAP